MKKIKTIDSLSPGDIFRFVGSPTRYIKLRVLCVNCITWKVDARDREFNRDKRVIVLGKVPI